MRLIDADALKIWIDCGHLRSPTELCFSELDVVRILDMRPTINAVPVVRCKDCQFAFQNNGHDKEGCPIMDRRAWMNGNSFCSEGKLIDKQEETK